MNRKTWNRELLIEAGRQFDLRGKFLEGTQFGSGHINDTFAVVYEECGSRIRYIHQRLNPIVFGNPRKVMENVTLVCDHLRARIAAEEPAGEVSRRALTLVRRKDGQTFWVDDEGDYWRTFLFIESASTYDLNVSETQAMEAARAFGRFQALLSDLPAGLLHEIIPGFHNTPKRIEALKQAVKADVGGRAASAGREIEFALAREPLAHALIDLRASGDLPLRITHNDTKLNNVMLDDRTGEGLCVIDLDTVMPGLSLYDFGDLVRTATSPAPEDERDLSKVRARPRMFEAITMGFLSAGSFLNRTEQENLVLAGQLMTFETGVRFLTDHLAGDVYFKIQREGHNLDRCRAQFQLVRSLEEQEDDLRKIANSISAQTRTDPA